MLGPNEVQVGFLKYRPKLAPDGSPVSRVVTKDATGNMLATPIVEPVLQGHGMRIMHADMLGRIARWLTQHNQQQIANYVVGWVNPEKLEPPDMAQAKEMLETLRGMTRSNPTRGQVKDNAYIEAAIFCIQAWLDAAEVSAASVASKA